LPNSTGQPVPVAEYVRREHSPISHLAHDWELYSSVLLSPAEERTMVREPAQAVPDAIAARVGRIRVLLVPYISCAAQTDAVCFSKPTSDTHTSVWVDVDGVTNVLLACREMDAHDTGFELLACMAELVRPQFRQDEIHQFDSLLWEELDLSFAGEIDEEALRAKKALNSGNRRRNHEEFEKYRDVALVGTLAEYMHGLWHDVQIRVGPDHLPVPQLRRRMELMARLFPPNEGYHVFDEELENTAASDKSSDE
jgi:hypothetical protein